MKPSRSDYLSIAAALVAILLCGYGMGFLIGERTAMKRLSATNRPGETLADWSAATRERLSRELELTPEQQAAVDPEVSAIAARIAGSRQHAMREYRGALLDLHDRILPHLNEQQRKQIEISRKALKSELDK